MPDRLRKQGTWGMSLGLAVSLAAVVVTPMHAQEKGRDAKPLDHQDDPVRSQLSRRTQLPVGPMQPLASAAGLQQWREHYQQIQADQQRGEYHRALLNLERLIGQTRNQVQPGTLSQLLTQKAQILMLLGHHSLAVEVLCGERSAFCGAVAEPDRDPLAPVVAEQSFAFSGSGAAIALARQAQDRSAEVAALGSLGTVYWLQGRYDGAEQILKQAIGLQRPGQDVATSQRLWHRLVRVQLSRAERLYQHAQLALQQRQPDQAQRLLAQAQGADRVAIATLTQAPTSEDPLEQVQGQLLHVLPQQRLGAPASQSVQAIQAMVDQLGILPPTHSTLLARLQLATLWIKVKGPEYDHPLTRRFAPQTQCLSGLDLTLPRTILRQTQQLATRETNHPILAQTWGLLGHLAECEQQWQQAVNYTETALQYSDHYLWDWQLGRIYRAQGQGNAAAVAYRRAIDTLKRIRSDVAIANRDFQLDIRDSVSALYRQFAALQLSTGGAELAPDQPDAIDQAFRQALETLDELKLVELRNYLGNDCEFPINLLAVDQLEPQTAHLSTIMLADRVGIVLTLGGPQARSITHWISVGRQDFIQQLNTFRLNLERRADLAQRYRPQARQFYDWLIRPFAQDLAAAQIKTLVFSHDGLLNSIPMGALMNGDRYLIADYALATTPSLQVIAPKTPRPRLSVLAFGLTEASVVNTQQFGPLPAVGDELQSVQALFSRSWVIKDAEFTRDRIQQELSKRVPNVLHLATHTRFGFESANTFLVTGEAVTTEQPPDLSSQEDPVVAVAPINRGGSAIAQNPIRDLNQVLTLNELYQLIRQHHQPNTPIELLLLTGCETAAGSEREALGIAGLALQAGVKSTMATLWQVEDQASSQLVSSFYGHLKGGETKAAALRQAQLDWLAQHPQGKFSHAGYWAPFLLIGNWR